MPTAADSFDACSKLNDTSTAFSLALPMQMLYDEAGSTTAGTDMLTNCYTPATSSSHFANKSNIAKLHWWNTPASTLQFNKTIETSTVIKDMPKPRTDAEIVAISGQHSAQQPIESEMAALVIDDHKLPTRVLNMNRPHYIPLSAPHSPQYPQSSQSHQMTHQHSYSHPSTAAHTFGSRSQSTTPRHKQHHHQHKLSSPGATVNSNFSKMQTSHNMSCLISSDRPRQEEDISQHSQLLIKDLQPCVGLLNPNEEDEMKVTGYRRSRSRTVLCWICICLTCGLLRLVLHWWHHWYLIATHEICSLEEAEQVLIEEDYQGKHKVFYVKQVHHLDTSDMKPKLGFNSGPEKDKVSGKTVAVESLAIGGEGLDEKHLHLSVHFNSAHFKYMQSVRFFNCKQLRYVWDNQTQSFNKLNGLDVNVPSAYFHQQKGLSALEQASRQLVYGANEITVPYKDVKTLLFLEVLNPFYVFQIFSVVLWFTYDYYYYACVIVLMSVFGISMSIIQTKKNQDALRETVHNTGCALVLNEKGDVTELPTQRLVPGDIIEIPTNGCTMQCDAVLLSGNCILDESMLTGESVPVTKTPLPIRRDVIYDKKEHARHTLFCGTKIIQTRYIDSEKVLAIVINTGNITAKGGLIRSILYPPPVDYKFERDSYKFIECLALIALVGFIYTLVTKILRHIDPVKIAVESLDLITIVVPPALPAAMTVGRFYAQKRLEKGGIYCISPRSINVAGSIDCCCFDKTGTLTEEGLDLWGVVTKSATNHFQIPLKQINRLPCDNFLFGMVTCHSITIMNGKMRGDPLDLKMFESTGWILEDPKDIPDNQKFGLMHPTIVRQPKNALVDISAMPDETAPVQRQSSVDDLLADVGLLNGESKNDHGIIREFPFTSNLQRMSVITRRLSERNFNVYCKGSPEMLQQLCQPHSLPSNYSQQLAIFAKQGYRVIAMAYKPLSTKMNYTKVQRLPRENVECDLEFLGFVVLENRLKPDTTDVITALTSANIRTIMVTGDNILTAMSVARDCGIVSANQAVVTVNVRQLRDDEHHGSSAASQTRHAHNYELYYTLELGSKDCMAVTVNGNGNGALTKSMGKNVIDYTAGGDYPVCNGDVTSLNSDSVTLPNSSSLASVQTCDTWTHHDVDVELAMKATYTIPGNAKDNNINRNIDKNYKAVDSWRNNYRFAMAGKTWQVVREHFPDELRNFITRGAIFARMSPEQKQSLIMELQSIDYCVAMCGDGANDCGALKVAHTGISLSETESSIASPFTSRQSTIACVPSVIKEGRAALVTSFGIFKYMATYSMIQFISVMILYSIDSNLTDKQFLYVDLCLISVFAFFFGKTEAYGGALVKQVPLSSLISLTPLSSLILHLLVVVAFQVSGWFQLHQQPWFVPFQLSDDDHLGCYENYTMFAISSFQYVILALIFSKGAPYRKPIWSNLPFCVALLVNLILVIYLIVYPPEWLAQFFQLIVPPVMSFRYMMLIYGICNFFAHLLVETVIVEYLIFKKFQTRRERNMRTSKRKYMQIECDLQYFHSWPQITDSYEAFEPSTTAREAMKPMYVEISVEQNFEMSAPKNNALCSFFEMDTDGSATTTPTVLKNSPDSPLHVESKASGT